MDSCMLEDYNFDTELHIDSLVVKAIKLHGNESWKGRSCVEKIHSLLALDWEVVIHHSYREANQCANALANYGCSMDTGIIYFDVSLVV
ncbi:ethylene responsive transcription factor 1b [Trifolium pratense]|uniref:Ethylene responsive transcription factor 1b n=1 Tax=Trifolium pratense TaxID=57577 RepID=A0A2K3P096_TRIPR|nr:ethylene responsive transcription factor 1b [Trifolium pratense]